MLIETLILTTKKGDSEQVVITSDFNVLELYKALYGSSDGKCTLNEIAVNEATKQGIEVQRKYLKHQEDINALSLEQSVAYNNWIQEETDEFLSELAQDSTDLNPLFISKFVGETIYKGINDFILNSINIK